MPKWHGEVLCVCLFDIILSSFIFVAARTLFKNIDPISSHNDRQWMNLFVNKISRPLGKAFVAHLTLERMLAGMSVEVNFQISRSGK